MEIKEIKIIKLESLENIQKELKKREGFIHESADVHPQAQVGEGTRIWQFCVLTSAAKVGENCEVGAGSFIDGEVGNYCKLANGSNIYSGVHIGDNVFISHGVAFANVSIPRTYRSIPRDGYKQTYIEDGVTFEPNCTIAPGMRIGKGSIVGMGSVVLEDIPPGVLVHGNPAHISMRSYKNKYKHNEKENA